MHVIREAWFWLFPFHLQQLESHCITHQESEALTDGEPRGAHRPGWTARKRANTASEHGGPVSPREILVLPLTLKLF